MPVVFVTAYDEFALKAFEVHAVDYLLKPLRRAAGDRPRSRARARAAAAPAIGALRASARQPGEPLERVVIRDGAHVHVVPVEKIDYVEAQDDYVAFRTGGKMILKEQTMTAMSRRRSIRARFVRIHRSYMLNIERLVARRAVREGQPCRHPRRRHQAAGQPGRAISGFNNYSSR